MEKVISYKLLSGMYRSTGVPFLCATIVREYLDVHEAFDLHISTRCPSGDNFYPIIPKGPHWHLEDVRGAISLWPGDADDWLFKEFRNAKRLYVWAME